MPRAYPLEGPAGSGSRRPPAPRWRERLGGDRDALQDVELVEDHPGSSRHAGERIFGGTDGQPGLLVEQGVEAAQEGPATGEDDAVIADVGGQLGRRLLETGPHRG